MRKLSEIHGEEAMEVISLLMVIGQRVTSDKALQKYLTGEVPKGKTSKEWSDEFAAEFFKIIFGKYRKDCTRMLAAVEGVSEADYLKESDIMKITSDLNSLTSDGVFHDLFFASAQNRISGSASENTTGQK